MIEQKNAGKVRLFLPKDTGSLDECIIRHIANEMRIVLLDGLSDLDEYGDGFEWDVLVEIAFEKVEVK